MKKVIAAFLIIVILGAAAWIILLRPSDYTDEKIISIFESKKDSFITMAEYLTEYNVSTTIEGFLSVDNRYGVPMMNEKEYKDFSIADQAIMSEYVCKVVSGGGRVEFFFLDEGGLLNKVDAKIVFTAENIDDPSAKKLSEKGWYLYM